MASSPLCGSWRTTSSHALPETAVTSCTASTMSCSVSTTALRTVSLNVSCVMEMYSMRRGVSAFMSSYQLMARTYPPYRGVMPSCR